METIRFSKKDIGQFKKMDILAIYLFGSMAAGKYIHGLSDYDFGVVLKDVQRLEKDELDFYGKLYDIIIDKLPKKYLTKRMQIGGHEFDIVFLQKGPVSFQAQAMQNGKLLYVSDNDALGAYKDRILEQYCDLKYIYEIAHHSLLERL